MSNLKVVTWNVNSIRKRAENVSDWFNQHKPDVVCFQETKVVDELFPEGIFEDCGYEVAFHGQKAYNGVAIASRKAITDVKKDLVGIEDGQARVIEATIQDVRIVCVYVPNGQAQGTEKFVAKLEFYEKLTKRSEELRNEYSKVIITGDYNVAPTNDDVYDIDHWGHGTICVSPPEREVYEKLLAVGYLDAHNELKKEAHSHTWWDFRTNSFNKNRGLRIDHFLIAGGLNCKELSVDLNERANTNPSDHAPVIFECDY